MSYNSKNVRAVEEIFQCTSRPKLAEGACQESWESRTGKVMSSKRPPTLRELSFQFHH